MFLWRNKKKNFCLDSFLPGPMGCVDVKTDSLTSTMYKSANFAKSGSQGSNSQGYAKIQVLFNYVSNESDKEYWILFLMAFFSVIHKTNKQHLWYSLEVAHPAISNEWLQPKL